MVRVATWNVNSVKQRVPRLLPWLDHRQPDVVCLQETKTRNHLFPLLEATALGYPYSFLHGMAGYHGVAVLSKLPLDGTRAIDWCGKEDCRHVRVELPGGIELHNLYVPAGGDVPDPEVNPKFAHKLEFLRDLTGWFEGRRDDACRAVLVGDLNVAPLETDVWSHRQLLDVVCHTPVEVEAFGRLQASCGWVDAMRRFVPPEERLFTWWSYRNRDWASSDRGRRLDHVLVTPALEGSLRGVEVLRAARDWPNPSDHVPVTVELEV